MLGYGRDESAPTPCGVFVDFSPCVCCKFRGVFATFWQSVSSRRGPIYRARIYECTHEMEDGNVRAMMWKCVCDYVYTYI